jgi:hypothetical protein
MVFHRVYVTGVVMIAVTLAIIPIFCSVDSSTGSRAYDIGPKDLTPEKIDG